MEDKNVATILLSRRQALKSLAAVSGAAALSSLPNGWEKPQLAVGAMPAKAQDGSGLAIDQASLELSGDVDEGGGGDTPGFSPVYVTIEFDYVNAVGGVTLMDVTFDWEGWTGQDEPLPPPPTTLHVEVDNPDGTAGHINHTIQDVIPNGCQSDLSIFIQDGSGQTSNTVTGMFSYPCG